MMHKLEPAGGHMDSVVAMLEDSERDVRQAAVEKLGKLEAAALAQHAAAVVAMLEDSDVVVRFAALETLGKLETAALAPYEQALYKASRSNKYKEIRAAAAKMLARLQASS